MKYPEPRPARCKNISCAVKKRRRRGGRKAYRGYSEASGRGEFIGKTASQYREWIECMEKPLVTMSRMNKPVIAQVQGVAAANGAGLVAAADLAVAGEDARLGFNVKMLGITFPIECYSGT